MGTAKLVEQNLGALALAQIAPVRHLDEEAEAVGESRIQGLGPEILVLLPMVAIGGRIHGASAIAQFLEFHPLHAPFCGSDEMGAICLSRRSSS
jgi:hypothetical protein